MAMGCEYHALVNPNEKYWPDAVILVPGGKAVFVEIKADRAKKDERYFGQVKTLVRLEHLKFDTLMVDDLEHEQALYTLIEGLCAQAR